MLTSISLADESISESASRPSDIDITALESPYIIAEIIRLGSMSKFYASYSPDYQYDPSSFYACKDPTLQVDPTLSVFLGE